MEPVCYMRHVRKAGICAKGSRVWCQANGVDWSDFLANGIASERLLATKDPIVLRVVEEARKEARDE